MARTLLTPVSAVAANEIAAIYIAGIGAIAASHSAIYDFVPGKPTRRVGKRRKGQHRSHTCSRTSAGSNKKGN